MKFPALHRLGVVAHAFYYLSVWEVEAEGSEVQGHPHLHSEFKTSLGT